MAKTYQSALQKDGYTVAHATTAQAAVLEADKHRPDVVLLELQLPGHSGVEFLHEFRSYPEWQLVPVVAHTMIRPQQLAAIEQSLRRDLGVVAVLYKPRTNLALLLRSVREAGTANEAHKSKGAS